MSLTEILAMWGAGLSTLLLIIKIVEYRRDRASVKVRVKSAYRITPTTPVTRENVVWISAVNTGRRPITLKDAGLRLPRKMGGSDMFNVDNTRDIELTEGKSQDYYMNEDTIKKDGLTPDKYVAYVRDATGKYYWSHCRIKRFIKLGSIK